MKMPPRLRVVLLLAAALIVWRVPAPAMLQEGAPARPDAGLLRSAYGGGETMRYLVSWMGVTAGELLMEVIGQEGGDGPLQIRVTVRSAGVLAVFYPVEDSFATLVNGGTRLPERYEMIQKEGRRQNRKITVYDQDGGRITYTKNNEAPELFEVDGPVHNEFSSFLFLRVLPFAPGQGSVVPTFADKKRHAVAVTLETREAVDTIFGRKNALQVRPHLTFKGLYQKVGDPLIWLTDDPARIPVKINAKIVIGSLTADLVEYHGPAGNCGVSP
jgi:hypothetical protein